MQILLNGLISGLTIAVLALGFSVVFLPTRIFHIALGAIYASAPYVAWSCTQAGLSWYVAVPAALAVAVALSVACEWVNHVPLERSEASSGAHLIASLGIYIALVQVIALVWGNQPKTLRAGLDKTVEFGDVILTYAQGLAGLTSLVVLALFFAWLQYTNLGLRLRVLADNPKELALRGFNVQRIRLLAFGVSGLLAGVSALVEAYDLGFDPHKGLLALLAAIVATIIGGRHSLFLGPVLGGLLVGIAQAEVSWVLSSSWEIAVSFLLLAVFLLVRPQGITGQTARVEADV